MLRRQFLQGDAGVFDRVLGAREVAAVVSELVEPYRERIYPPLDTLRLRDKRINPVAKSERPSGAPQSGA